MVNIEPKYNEKKQARSFIFTLRYIDDVFQLNNSKFADFVGGIHPIEFAKNEYNRYNWVCLVPWPTPRYW